MSIIDRIGRALSYKPKIDNATSTEMDQIVEEMIAQDPALADMDIPETKEWLKPDNKLKIYQNSTYLRTFYTNLLRNKVSDTKAVLQDLPPDDPYVDHVLADFWKNEPILAGAVYSMSTKMSALSWTMVGTKRLATQFANILDTAWSMNGQGWGDFLSVTAQDFYTVNRGAYWITPRRGSHLTGNLEELGAIDALCCAMTGNVRKPVFYSSVVTGQDLYLRQGEFARFVSMPSPREELFGNGVCAVHRAYKAARILLGLSRYDWEKLNNLPPEGVAAVTGLTQDEFQDSLAIWRQARKGNNSLTFPQVLWLLGAQPNTTVGVDFVGFSQIPESFDRGTVIDQYVNTLALDFGVDAREFWPISSGSLGTASETEVQHMKAKGKGPGEFISIVERWLNAELPNGVEFGFDTQDVGEDQIAASIAKGWIDAFMPLYAPGNGTPQSKSPTAPGVTAPEGGASQSNMPQGQGQGAEPLINKDQFLRLLVDRRVLPNWVVNDKKVMRTDLGITEKELVDIDDDQPITITYKEGVFSYSRPVPYELYIELPIANLASKEFTPVQGTNGQADAVESIAADFNTIEPESKIRGKPIPVGESLRGPRVKITTVKSELELWRQTPELAVYVPTPDEHEYTQVLESVE